MKRRASGLAAAITAVVVGALVLCAVGVSTAGAKALTAKQIANKVLKLDPRKPSDINLFTSVYQPGGQQGFYPQGSAMNPASGPTLTEALARSRLKTYLQDQFPNDAAKVNSALTMFDGQKAKSLIPDPQLRAAFVGMKGTLLQPTIDHLLNGGRFNVVRYGGLPVGAVAASGGGQIVVSRRYQSEDFRYLIGVMGHEVLHDDDVLANAEEAINNSLTAMTQLKVLSKHPELAYRGTELGRLQNSAALIFLNSREDGSPNSEIYAPTGKGIAPGSPRNAPDMWTYSHGDATTSPAPGTLGQITRSLGLRTTSKFSLATAKTFANLNDNWLSDVGRVQISVLLQMLSVKTVADKANLSRSQVISKLHLRPYLDAIK